MLCALLNNSYFTIHSYSNVSLKMIQNNSENATYFVSNASQSKSR